MAKQLKFKDGDKIVFGCGKKNSALYGVTIGKVYQLYADDVGTVVFDTDSGYKNDPNSPTYVGKPTKIVEA